VGGLRLLIQRNGMLGFARLGRIADIGLMSGTVGRECRWGRPIAHPLWVGYYGVLGIGA
jgi:hypothetical protein